MMFASRLSQHASRNRLALALERRRAEGRAVIDLTLSNPTEANFAYPDGILESLALDQALHYQPEPFGLPGARQAVAAELSRRANVSADRIVLTASTSEAYSFLFRLLCDPGDAVLAPRPSYPLIEHLADLDAVSVEYYSLDFHGRWAIDMDGLRHLLSTPSSKRIRAIVVISPNNPTGSTLSAGELEELAGLARRHGVALIADEVFADFAISGSAPRTALEQDKALTFVLGGLSKSAGLPQLKLGWIATSGPANLVDAALERLEVVCDTYLSVSTPVQVALPHLLAAGAVVRGQIQERVRRNFARLTEAAAACPACSVLPADAGWSAVVQVPAIRSEEDIVLDLLNRTGVLVHPGYFFDFEREAFLVLSLLPDPRVFSEGVSKLFAAVGIS